jgi:hypothetical protein
MFGEPRAVAFGENSGVATMKVSNIDRAIITREIFNRFSFPSLYAQSSASQDSANSDRKLNLDHINCSYRSEFHNSSDMNR